MCVCVNVKACHTTFITVCLEPQKVGVNQGNTRSHHPEILNIECLEHLGSEPSQRRHGQVVEQAPTAGTHRAR